MFLEVWLDNMMEVERLLKCEEGVILWRRQLVRNEGRRDCYNNIGNSYVLCATEKFRHIELRGLWEVVQVVGQRHRDIVVLISGKEHNNAHDENNV